MNLVTKVYFPKEILPIAIVAANLVDFFVASLVFIGLLFFYNINISLPIICLPFLLITHIALILGIVFLGAAFDVFFRDIRFIVTLGLQLWMYATPIIYPVSLVPEKYRLILMLNPMTGIIEAYRAVILRSEWPNWTYLGISILTSFFILYFGYNMFKKLEYQFADII